LSRRFLVLSLIFGVGFFSARGRSRVEVGVRPATALLGTWLVRTSEAAFTASSALGRFLAGTGVGTTTRGFVGFRRM
jgi:hypothetical protein